MTMFDWEKKLKELSEYNISFEVKQGYYHIAIKYDDSWSVLESDNQNIYIEKRNDFYHYLANTEYTTISDIFREIDLTIEYNLDLQKKITLFKEKVDEMQEIFSREKFEVLENLTFVYKTGTSKPTKKRGRKPKKEKEKEENVKEVEVVNNVEKEETTPIIDKEIIEQN